MWHYCACRLPPALLLIYAPFRYEADSGRLYNTGGLFLGERLWTYDGASAGLLIAAVLAYAGLAC